MTSLKQHLESMGNGVPESRSWLVHPFEWDREFSVIRENIRIGESVVLFISLLTLLGKLGGEAENLLLPPTVAILGLVTLFHAIMAYGPAEK